MKKVLATAGLIICSLANASAKPHHKHTTKHGPMLHANYDAQIAQNRESDKLGLIRIKNKKQLLTLVRSGKLVFLTDTPSLVLSPKLPLNRRYLLPWAKQLLMQMSTAYTARFGQPLTLTSAVRTMQVQRSLLRWNGNAAPIHGETASSHETGATFDVSRKGMTQEENEWMRAALLAYTVQNRVIYLEETVQPCFHIFTMPPKEPII